MKINYYFKEADLQIERDTENVKFSCSPNVTIKIADQVAIIPALDLYVAAKSVCFDLAIDNIL